MPYNYSCFRGRTASCPLRTIYARFEPIVTLAHEYAPS